MSYSNNTNRIYRSRSGMILGVCKGIGIHFDISVFWLRFGTVLLALLSGVWPIIIIYIIAALIMKPEPIVPFENDAESEFYDSYASSPNIGLKRLKREFDDIDRRIRRMEDIVTSKDFSWESRLNKDK
jgi:phage shock protein C